jgi:hypothetical protein
MFTLHVWFLFVDDMLTPFATMQLNSVRFISDSHDT